MYNIYSFRLYNIYNFYSDIDFFLSSYYNNYNFKLSTEPLLRTFHHVMEIMW